MALPRGDPHSMPQLPVEDERELLVIFLKFFFNVTKKDAK
jgi:hypothetical protein